MDRITGLKDLQDYGLLLSWVLIKDRLEGLLFKAKLGVKYGQDCKNIDHVHPENRVHPV